MHQQEVRNVVCFLVSYSVNNTRVNQVIFGSISYDRDSTV